MLKKEQLDNHAFNKFFLEKPKDMSNTEWIKEKHRIKKDRIEQEKQLKLGP